MPKRLVNKLSQKSVAEIYYSWFSTAAVNSEKKSYIFNTKQETGLLDCFFHIFLIDNRKSFMLIGSTN